jgi:YHS domain-containing protein
MKTKLAIPYLAFAGLLLLAVVGLSSCKQEPEASQTEAVKTDVEETTVVAQATEQTTCPVMEGQAIDKDIFVEYKGKKVYFCCEPCTGKFNAEPEKYLAKLPQFSQATQPE